MQLNRALIENIAKKERPPKHSVIKTAQTLLACQLVSWRGLWHILSSLHVTLLRIPSMKQGLYAASSGEHLLCQTLSQHASLPDVSVKEKSLAAVQKNVQGRLRLQSRQRLVGLESGRVSCLDALQLELPKLGRLVLVQLGYSVHFGVTWIGAGFVWLGWNQRWVIAI